MWHLFFQKASQEQFTSTVDFSEAFLVGVLLAWISGIQS